MYADLVTRALFAGLPITVSVALISMLVTTVFAFPAGLARMSKHRALRWPANVYVELFRGMSAYVWLFLMYFVVPQFLIQLDPFWCGSVTLGLVGGAYSAEIVRGAIQAVPRGQSEAAIALNFSPTRRMIGVIMPQAIVAMLPPMTNMYIMGLKATALVSLIGLSEMVSRAQSLREILPASSILIFGELLLFYLVLALFVAAAMRLMEQALKRRWGLSVAHRPLPISEGAVL